MTHSEPARRTRIVESVGVVVAGGGPAGVAAALAAARGGVSVRLLECQGQLGGVWTSGLLSWVLDAGEKGGIMAELLHRLDAREARQPISQGGIAYDPEAMKLILERACLDAGVGVRLHTRIVSAPRISTPGIGINAEDQIAVAITESKSGREGFAAHVYIDATGDGDLAALAGCGYDLGRPARGPGSRGPERAGETQPMSLLCLVTGIDHDATAAFHQRADRPWAAPKEALLAEFRRGGVTPSYGMPTIFPIHRGLYAWMVNHEYAASALNAQSLTDATLRARCELHKLIDALRALGGVWEHLRIVTTAAHIGIREARRIHGRYTVTLEDMLRGARFDDAVCRATFPIDVHATASHRGESTSIESNATCKTQPYDIPYRALLAADVSNLLLAGRCISGDFLAHSSYRVTGNAVALGEAAGTAAAHCVTHHLLPAQVQWPIS